MDAPVAVTLARAQADPSCGLSGDTAFHAAAHERFGQLLPEIPAAQPFDSEEISLEEMASAVLDAIGVR
jgi:hypothetical protein